MADNMQKIKLLKLYEFLKNETDEEHPITRRDLSDRLCKMGISSNPRTLSLDIETLNENGFEVMSAPQGKEKVYYVADRAFSVPEIKIMIDAIQAASFVTEKKTAELVNKIAALGGARTAEKIKDNMVLFNTRKHKNEQILYTVDALERAIDAGEQVYFNYFHMDGNKKRVYVKDEDGNLKRYTVEPVALVFVEDNYYLVAYSEKHPGSTASYRIDRMDGVGGIAGSRVSKEALSFRAKTPDLYERTFRMFGGDQTSVTLQFDEKLFDHVYDRFGEDVRIKKLRGGLFETRVSVRVSPVFYGWVFQFGGRMKIIEPETVAREYEEMKKEGGESK